MLMEHRNVLIIALASKIFWRMEFARIALKVVFNAITLTHAISVINLQLKTNIMEYVNVISIMKSTQLSAKDKC